MTDQPSTEDIEVLKHYTKKMLATFNGLNDKHNLELARTIAKATIEEYGDFNQLSTHYIQTGLLVNDNPTVQAVLATIKLLDIGLLKKSSHSDNEFMADFTTYDPLLIARSIAQKALDKSKNEST